MPTDIKCPNCGHQFPMEDAVAEQYKKDLREQMISFNKKKEEEYQSKFAEVSRQLQQQQENFNKRLVDEKKQWQQGVEENLRKTISADFENQLHLLKQSNRDNEEKLKTARQKELEFLQKEQELINKQAELELSVQRKMQEERTKLAEEIRNLEEQRIAAKETEYLMRMKELEKQLEDQKKLVAEMNRKAEQGSMQLQGEVQELALEEMLKLSFPFDVISEVGKGVRGADCVQLVRNEFGQECGKIIYESKRTNTFSGDWIEKLKADMRSQAAQIAIIVTKTMPKDMSGFGERNGVWICNFSEVKALAYVMRDSLIRLSNISKSQQNKGDKMQMLYDYITSTEFSEQWKAIREGFLSMKNSIQKERDTMEKLWKAREKQLEKVLLNASHIKGSMEGIAGQDSLDMNLLDEPSNGELEME